MTASRKLIVSKNDDHHHTKVGPEAAIVATPTDSHPKTLFDLSGNICNESQDLVDMPDNEHGASKLYSDDDGQTTSAAFMTSSAALIQQTMNTLYRPLSSASQQVEIEFGLNGEIAFFGHKTQLKHAVSENFVAIRRVQTIHLDVHIGSFHMGSVHNPLGFCNVQDALFAVLGYNLAPGHMLQSLQVTMSDSRQPDPFVYVSEASESEQECSPLEEVRREMADVQPAQGNISRGHAIAFLTDPLRSIRMSGNEHQQGYFKLLFMGSDVRP